MKLAVVFPVLNQFPLAQVAIKYAMGNAVENPDLVIIDNGSDEPFLPAGVVTRIPVRHEESIGVYPTFWDALKHTDADVLAFFHSDLIVCEDGWDLRVMAMFKADPNLGLLGFIGSNEIDAAGGRGLGTTSNFQGRMYGDERRTWTGSPARVHGKESGGFSPAAVVDGCAMIFRREVLEKIKQRPDFPPHHFYDRLLSSEVREKGWTMGVLGIACDHISGQTVNQEQKYADFAENWCRAHLPESAFVGNPPNYSWDMTVYAEAERQWLREYRDEKHLVPCRV